MKTGHLFQSCTADHHKKVSGQDFTSTMAGFKAMDEIKTTAQCYVFSHYRVSSQKWSEDKK